VLASDNGVLSRKLSEAKLRPVRSDLKRSALFNLGLPPQRCSVRGLHTRVLQPLSVASAATVTSVAFMVDLLLGLVLQLVPLLVAAVCASLCAVSCGYIDIDGIWYRWLMNEVARSKKRLKEDEVISQLRHLQPVSRPNAGSDGVTLGVRRALDNMNVRALKRLLDEARVDISNVIERADLVALALQHHARLDLQDV